MGDASRLLEFQQVLGEFCSTAFGKGTLTPETAKQDPAGFLQSYFWLLVSRQEQNQYLFSRDDPDYGGVVDRLRISVPTGAGEVSITEDTAFDQIYRFPLEELNAGIARYFEDFRFEPEDFPTEIPSPHPGEFAFLYDRDTHCVYMPCVSIGREDPQPLFLICEEQTAQNGNIRYTMLGIEMDYENSFYQQENKSPTLNSASCFGDFQQRLALFAEENPNGVLYSVQATVNASGQHYSILSLQTAALNPENAGTQQRITEWLHTSRNLRAERAVATPIK